MGGLISFRGCLVDRGRRVVRKPLPERVEGTTQFRTVRYPWFRCRFTLNQAADSDDPQAGRRRTPQTGTIMVGLRDRVGNPLHFKASDRIEIYSRQLGHAIYEATSEPEPIRKKRRMLGHMVNLTQVLEHDFDQHG